MANRSLRSTPKPPPAFSIVPTVFGLLTALTVAGYPEAGRWIAFAAATALALIDGARQAHRQNQITIDLLDILLAGLIAYGALSLIWSANANGGIQTVIIATACLVLATYLKRRATPALMTAIAAGTALGVIATLATNLWLPPTQWSGFGNSGYAAEALVLALPFLWILWRDQSHLAPITRFLAVATAILSVGYVVIFTPSLIGAFVAAALASIGSIVWAFRRKRRLGWIFVVAWAMIPAIVGFPAWDRLHLTERVLVRVELWLNAGFMILDRPLFGHGAGSFIEVYPLYKEAHGELMPFVNKAFESYVTEAEALHNETLQVWTELGLVGLVPLLAFFALALKSAAARLCNSPFVAAGGVALLVVLSESCLEYPFQRAATLFLAVIALAFATHGSASGIRRWHFRLSPIATIATLPVATVASVLLLFASLRQYEAETRLEKIAGLDPVAAFNAVYEAHAVDPLERRIRTTLPILLDGLVRARGLDAVPPALIDGVFRDVDDGGHFNTAALVARAQLQLDMTGGNDSAFLATLADLKRGSAHVAAAYAIEARYLIGQKRLAEALPVIAEGLKYTEGRSSVPGADEAMKTHLLDLQRIATEQMQEQAGQPQKPASP